jgi:hypothetical protein
VRTVSWRSWDKGLFENPRCSWQSPSDPKSRPGPGPSASPVTTAKHQRMVFRLRHTEWRDVPTRYFRKTVGTTTAQALGETAAEAQLAHSDPAVTGRHHIATSDQGPDVREALKGFSIQSGQFPVTPNPPTRHRPPAMGP